MSIFAYILVNAFLLKCTMMLASCSCVEIDSCYDAKAKQERRIGESFMRGDCSKCTCEEKRSTIITCYHENVGRFARYRPLLVPQYYDIEVPEEDILMVQDCPLGMKKLTSEVVDAQFYLTYYTPIKFSRCCESVPVAPRFCTAVRTNKNTCDYQMMLSINLDIHCPTWLKLKGAP